MGSATDDDVKPIDYDSVAHAYDRRYDLHEYPGIRSAIIAAAEGSGPGVLEVGCGTGTWLAELASAGHEVAGVDPSVEMLDRAAAKVACDLRVGRAEALPWEDARCGLVLFVNSLHHIDDPELALREAFRVLRPGGQVLSIGLDPHETGSRWFVYEFFPATLQIDFARFAPSARRREWLSAAGFSRVGVRVAERIASSVSLDEALQSGVLERTFTSQLTALSPDEHATGMAAIRHAASRSGAFTLQTDLLLFATSAFKPSCRTFKEPTR